MKFCQCDGDATTLGNEARLLDRIPKEQRQRGFVEIRATNIAHSMPFVVYEYVDGGNLFDYLDTRFRLTGPCSPLEAAIMMLEILRPIAIAHKQTPPIVHCDLKPQNILVSRSGFFPPEVKIADFGLGRLSVSASVIASKSGVRKPGGYTAMYASPEQIDRIEKQRTGEVRDFQAYPSDDVHALGVIWYELLSGKLFRGRPSGAGWKEDLAKQGMTDDELNSCSNALTLKDFAQKTL